VLFLKYLDDLEVEREIKAKLAGKPYKSLFEPEYQWRNWAVPKDSIGKIDFDRAKTGEDLTQFVNSKLFPYLAGFKQSATSPATLEYKVGEIFSEVKNRIQSGYNLREVLDLVDVLKFQTTEELHEMSFLYENKIKNMGNAGRNGGEYYTPRPLIKAIIEVVGPKVGQTIYDGAAGSAGFLCEAFAYLLQSKKLTSEDIETLQTKTFFGKEKKSLAYVIGIMNMILHGIDAPNIIHTNTLGENIADIQEKDRHDIVLANPPFGGKERKEVQQNFPIKTGETAYLFLQHFMKILKTGGSAGIVIKNTFLSNTDNAAIAVRRELLENFNLHTVLDCPQGTFQGAGVKTVVLFFKKGEPTKDIWFYQLDPKRSLGKTSPLNDSDLAEFVAYASAREITNQSWIVDISDVDQVSMDLTVKNPNKPLEDRFASPIEILDELTALDEETTNLLNRIRGLL
jgi:type I restriction enzyme M protein